VRGTEQEQTSVDGFPLQLTRREADVFARLREGMTPKQIAFELGLSAVTVRRHLSSVARKARQARPPDSRARIDVLTRTGPRRSDRLRRGAPTVYIKT